ncbi:hypothetical protein MPTK1_5g14210 [Marchantia polymorpha subsp. ruderalis]|uniref:Uncharacterized protein n=2 Tax=Marchantia polymorpha TaxID=3197 RepID=A0AAF6BI87_MARPO|nr:hypothetical protein MARPO_0032s0113 [Marchantia polymorpha]BBN11721.1 hypothetical protein Mp_5g14210 [Marchantia polymorpha subsp. ruderalis]|eukprot:PTQ41938.1 hypothetical protein MARPO_0032s0113 [Marchantia polymorpha]
MGNVMGKKKRKAAAIAKAKAKANEHVVALTSTSYLQIELPREIVEDLERPRKGPGGWGAGIADPAHEMYEKLKSLDQPAVMVPKPWSEVDQILSKLKPQASAASPKTPRFMSPSIKAKEKMVLEAPPSPPASIIDMGELMDGLDDEARRSISLSGRNYRDELNIDPMEFIKTKPFNPRKVKSLEHTLSFSTIHTVRELDAGPSKAVVQPETVENVLRRRGASPARRSNDMSSPARLSHELSRRSNELTRRSSEILRRSTEIQRRSSEFQRRSSEQPRPFSEISFAHADSLRSLVSG